MPGCMACIRTLWSWSAVARVDEFSAAFSPAFDPVMITTVEQVTQWLGAPTLDPALIKQAWLSAEAYVGNRTDWDITGQPDDDLVLAVDLSAARYLQRRNSPDGIVGLGDLGPAQVPYSDVDVERLINPWRIIAVA